MNPSEFPSAGGSKTPPPSSKKHPQCNEPRPTDPTKQSHKIKKPPLAPSSSAVPPVTTQQRRQDMILTVFSAADFKDLVQHLTGLPRHEDDTPAVAEDMSPAPRLTSIEKTTGMLTGSVDMGPFHGILSPVPSSLPPVVPSGFFLPEKDTVPLSDEFWSALSSTMPKTKTVPFRDDFFSALSSAMDSQPVTDTVPFSEVLWSANSSSGSLSSAMVSSPPVTETAAQFSNELLSASSAMVYSLPPASPPTSPTKEAPEWWFKPFYRKRK